MNKPKYLFLLLLLLAANLSWAQTKNEVVHADLKKVLWNVELSKLVFVADALVEACSDTAIQSQFGKKISASVSSGNRYSEDDRKETQVVLKLLYDSISKVQVTKSQLAPIKSHLLNILQPYRKLDFSVDHSLIRKQLDKSKRSMANGYDEGSTSESKFIFFLYNPELLREALLSNGMDDKWGRIGIFICNYIRENENPLWLRKRMQSGILWKLNKMPTNEDLKTIKVSLEKCSIFTNRFD